MIERALQEERLGAAKDALDSYRAQAGAKEEKIAAWRQQIASIEQRSRHRAAEAEKRSARQRREQFHRVLPQLDAKYPGVQGVSADTLRLWILKTSYTVLGRQFFNNVEVRESSLALWVSDPNQVRDFTNLSAFADIADLFVVWCRCDGETTVGIDMSHLRAGKAIVFRYRLNPETARSAWW